MWREEHAPGLRIEAARRAPKLPIASTAFTLLLAASLSPALLVRIPAMVDYPNHLARMYILSHAGGADANPFYETAWALYPNLAMDLVIPLLAQLFGVETATRVFLLLSQVLVVTGAMAIERVVKGRQQISAFVALMFLYCLPFAWGFLNFEFGIGVALWGIAAWLVVQERPWPLRLAVNALFVAALFAAHFFSLGIYGATLGLHELWRAHARRAPRVETTLRLFVLALPAALVLGAMALTTSAVGASGTAWFLVLKPLWLLHIMNGYSLTLSAVSVAAAAAFVRVAAKRGMVTVEPAVLWLAIGFAALYVLIPARLVGTSFADLRVIAAAAFILPAFCRLELTDRRWRFAALSGAVAITLANLAGVLFVWLSYRADYAAMIDSFRKIEKGSQVLVAKSDDAGDPPLGHLIDYPMYHAPTLATYYADAFVPTLFATPGKQPIAARDAYRRFDVTWGGIAAVDLLAVIAERGPADGMPAFIRAWPRDYDYLYVIGPHSGNPMPERLQELEQASRFVLYKIRK
jgi:hypothetical protein